MTVDDVTMIATSFPEYQDLMRDLGAVMEAFFFLFPPAMSESSKSESIVIAVDGTAASGKGTLAEKLAQHFGFAHLDSGALYRLTALAVLEAGGDPSNETDALRGAQTIDFNRAGDPKIRTDTVGKAASYVAAIPRGAHRLVRLPAELPGPHPPAAAQAL